MKIFVVLVVCLCGTYIEAGGVKQTDRQTDLSADDARTDLSNNENKTSPETTFAQLKRKKRYIILTKSPFLLANHTECSDSSDDFPSFFTTDQREKGAIILVFLVGIYCFTILAIICDNYFLPCVERICEVLNLSQDVAAATFMSVATSAPELFVNLIGTFITESDIGIGTIVGSSLFNALGVASLGGLAASKPIQLDWWPLTRDVIIYILAVFLLISITWDGVIYWYEGLVLFIVYFIYFTVMFNNVRIVNFLKRVFKKDNKVGASDVESAKGHNTNSERHSVSAMSHYGSYMEEPTVKYIENKDLKSAIEAEKQKEEEEGVISPFSFPSGSCLKKAYFIYTWPIRLVFFFTVPDPKRYPKLFPITFIMCIIFIGTNSYVVSWMISIIGSMFRIPDAVLGLTFLAAGGCLPESISLTIMSRRGEGSMGVSNSLGANTMNILLSLGMPWFMKTIIMGTNKSAFIKIESGSIEYTISALVLAATILYMTLYFNKFRLCKRVGVILISVYTVFIVFAILSEMVFFEKSTCEHLS